MIHYYDKPVKSKWMQIFTDEWSELFLLNTGSTFLSVEDMCVQAAQEFSTLGSTCEKPNAQD